MLRCQLRGQAADQANAIDLADQGATSDVTYPEPAPLVSTSEPAPLPERTFETPGVDQTAGIEIEIDEDAIAPTLVARNIELPLLREGIDSIADNRLELETEVFPEQESPIQTADFFNQLATQQQDLPVATIPGRDIEQINVIGRATSRSVAFRIERAERQLYDQYNALNSNDDFDIVCERRRTEDELIQMQVCEPVFLKNMREQNRQEVAVARNAGDSAVGNFFSTLTGPRLLTDEMLRYRARDELDQVQQEILAMSESDPAFRAQLQELGTMQARLDELLREEELREYLERPIGFNGVDSAAMRNPTQFRNVNIQSGSYSPVSAGVSGGGTSSAGSAGPQ